MLSDIIRQCLPDNVTELVHPTRPANVRQCCCRLCVNGCGNLHALSLTFGHVVLLSCRRAVCPTLLMLSPARLEPHFIWPIHTHDTAPTNLRHFLAADDLPVVNRVHIQLSADFCRQPGHSVDLRSVVL